MLIVLVAAQAFTAGCRSTSSRVNEDSTIRRQADAGREAFAEGYDAKAIDRYRAAVKRAWAIDDPFEISRNTYNLAAVLVSVSRYDEARDWLHEARDEAQRVGKSDAHIRLLEAKIARRQGFPYEATRITESVAVTMNVDHKSRTCRRCGVTSRSKKKDVDSICPHCGVAEGSGHVLQVQAECDKRKISYSKRDTKRRQKRAQKAAAEVQVHLMRANLACDNNQLETATAQVEEGRRKLRRIDDLAVHAEVQRVSGRIFMLKMLPRDAAACFDKEAELLRQAGHYREIPFALISAGEAYEMEAFIAVAGNRFFRAARILYGRDDLTGSALLIDRAIWLAEASGDVGLQGRLAVLFKEVVAAFEAQPNRSRADEEKHESLPTPRTDIFEDAPPVEEIPESHSELLPPTFGPRDVLHAFPTRGDSEKETRANLRFRAPGSGGPSFPQTSTGSGFLKPALHPGGFSKWLATPEPSVGTGEESRDVGVRQRYVDPHVARRVEERMSKRVR